MIFPDFSGGVNARWQGPKINAFGKAWKTPRSVLRGGKPVCKAVPSFVLKILRRDLIDDVISVKDEDAIARLERLPDGKVCRAAFWRFIAYKTLSDAAISQQSSRRFLFCVMTYSYSV